MRMRMPLPAKTAAAYVPFDFEESDVDEDVGETNMN